MSDVTKVAINDADHASLKHHAETILGLDIKMGTNSAGLRSMILTAAPKTDEIEQIGEGKTAAPAAAKAADRQQPAAPAAVKVPYSPGNPSADPKVMINIRKTDDPTRDKVATVSVNGVVTRMQRGQDISVPYRVYRALLNAIEKRAVLQDEEGPFGLPVYEYQEVQSYPFEVLAMPTDEEIDAWHAATSEQTLAEAA